MYDPFYVPYWLRRAAPAQARRLLRQRMGQGPRLAEKPPGRTPPKRARSRLAPPDAIEREMHKIARAARYAKIMGKPYQPSLASLSAQLGPVPRVWKRDGGVIRAAHEHEASIDRVTRWKSAAAVQDRFGWLLDPPQLRPKLRGVRLP